MFWPWPSKEACTRASAKLCCAWQSELHSADCATGIVHIRKGRARSNAFAQHRQEHCPAMDWFKLLIDARLGCFLTAVPPLFRRGQAWGMLVYCEGPSAGW